VLIGVLLDVYQRARAAAISRSRSSVHRERSRGTLMPLM